MPKHVIDTDSAPAAAGPYSQAIRANGLVFVSGQLPIDAGTGNMPESVADQTRQSLENVRAILAAEGLGLDSIVKTMVFLTDMDRFGEMNEVYESMLGGSPPARSAYQVVRLPKDALVEIEAIALSSEV